MNKKSQILAIFLVALVVISIVATYYRIFVRHDYQILMEISCDPTAEPCFVYQCDPEIEECTGDPEEDTWYYKLLEKNASKMPVCDAEAEECPEPTCAEGEMNCFVTSCDLEGGEECSSPDEFTEDGSVEVVDEVDALE
jgi:hypothetical protein